MSGGSTPMMRQYRAIKAQHPNAILLFRLGDFYEMFLDDAKTASQELEIALTTRGQDEGEPIPMCGVPYHSIDPYIARLVDRGYKVALCEQVEDPRKARGIVRREVVRVITPGTFMDERAVGAKENRFLAAVSGRGDQLGLAVMDLSTGQFTVSQFSGSSALRDLCHDLGRWGAAECLVDPRLDASGRAREALLSLAAETSMSFEDGETGWFDVERAHSALKDHFGTASLRGFGCEELTAAIAAGGGLLAYVEKTQNMALRNVTSLRTHRPSEYMFLDAGTRRNLELTERLFGGRGEGTLLGLLDSTVTAMGGRLLRQWVERPLVDVDPIRSRHTAVDCLARDSFTRADLRSVLGGIYDLERLVSRAAYGSATARDLVSLGQSLELLPRVAGLLGDSKSGLLEDLCRNLCDLQDLSTMLLSSLSSEPPPGIKDGGLFRDGYSDEVDRLRSMISTGKNWIVDLEAGERERTGIRSLRIGYNRVFGYYIEVTRTNLHLVPDHYQRKQTLINSERYVTEDLKEWEAEVLGAQDRLKELEYELFTSLRDEVAGQCAPVREAAARVAQIDALSSLAEVGVRNGYVLPEVNSSGAITIEGGRHPVLEASLAESFVPNDVSLDTGENRLLLITGPNMAGKSTYLRQVALIALMAQIGSMVPASRAEIGIADRIFTRVGAADDLARGQSTFMVEMNEVAEILNHATAQSLVILDEVGRGTSTFDGLSIAWALAEYIHSHEGLGCRTMFATHYHQLTALEGTLQGARNYSVAVRERGKDIVFLRQIVRGGTDRSYGLQVAKLAGIPDAVLGRAGAILRDLETAEDLRAPGAEAAAGSDGVFQQLALVEDESHPLVEELATLDVLGMTPLEALVALHDLRDRAARHLREDGGQSL